MIDERKTYEIQLSQAELCRLSFALGAGTEKAMEVMGDLVVDAVNSFLCQIKSPKENA